ncbi:hypothetical protein PH562_11140 [Rhizobium sp. CNPSo 4062]|uniref:hypothetical protein n=1 Tax=Rhizobium sp. CNPSo 4062 TaxID=3021410 RepID=UPI00254B037D|nr:hypothetical protein [Rhizobium sp. CNPSo 4062]MDK4702796.1 hypothetical protein [Rhizobium sp. CNPSo 4062]
MLAVEGLIGKVVAADTDILAKPHFTGCGGAKRPSKNNDGQHKRCERPPDDSKVERFHKTIPPLSRTIAEMAQSPQRTNDCDLKYSHKHVDVAKIGVRQSLNQQLRRSVAGATD